MININRAKGQKVVHPFDLYDSLSELRHQTKEMSLEDMKAHMRKMFGGKAQKRKAQ